MSERTYVPRRPCYMRLSWWEGGVKSQGGVPQFLEVSLKFSTEDLKKDKQQWSCLSKSQNCCVQFSKNINLCGQSGNWRWCYQHRIESLFGLAAAAARLGRDLFFRLCKLFRLSGHARSEAARQRAFVRRPKYCQRTENKKLTNEPTFPSDAVMFLRCRLHGGASSSNSLCPQQLHLQLRPSVSRSWLESCFPPATSSPTLQLPLPPSDGLCWCCGCLFHRMTPQRRMPWVTTAVRACLLPQSLLLPWIPLVDTECWSGQAGLWLVGTIQPTPHWSSRPPPDWLEMQKCTEKQQSSFRRLGTERGLLCRRDHQNWFVGGRGGGGRGGEGAGGGLCWSTRTDSERKASGRKDAHCYVSQWQRSAYFTLGRADIFCNIWMQSNDNSTCPGLSCTVPHCLRLSEKCYTVMCCTLKDLHLLQCLKVVISSVNNFSNCLFCRVIVFISVYLVSVSGQ